MKVYKIKVNGKAYKVELEAIDEVASQAAPAAAIAEAKKEAAPAVTAPKASGNGQEVPSPIQGTVVGIKVKVGDAVKKGTVLFIVEAMKLENDVVSPFDGTVTEILVEKGASVASKQPLAIIG